MTERTWVGLSPLRADGQACVICGRNLRVRGSVAVPVGRSVATGSQVFACEGICASEAAATAEGLVTAKTGRGSAVLSDCGTYRYELRRSWATGRPWCVWVMLNPSTADAELDDPTIRRCRGFARSWGYGGIVVVNLYALRATDPRQLRRHPDPVGDRNDGHIHTAVLGANAVVCAWGAHPVAARRAPVVTGILLRSMGTPTRVRCLGVTASGAPRHPLYTPRATEPIPFGEVA